MASSPSPHRFRIIPLTIVVASLFLAIKFVALIQGGQELSESLLVSQVQAETPAPASESEKPAENEQAEAPAPAEAGHGEDKKPEEEHGAEFENPSISTKAGDVTERRFTPVEIELLQKLSTRRDELDQWESNLQIKESTLATTEKRIDDKIAQIEAMKASVNAILVEYNKIEDVKIGSLVKIYENMKPAEAARIFDELEMPILLLVIDRMKEKKSAPILANMNTLKAKQVTVELAERRRVDENRMKQAGAAVSAPSGK